MKINLKYEVFPVVVPVSSSLRSVNFYLIKSEQSLILIDAGFNNEHCWDALQETLAQNDLSITDLTHIFLTHHHIDHVGLVNPIVELHPIPVYTHRASFPRLKRDEQFMQMRIEFFANLYEEMGCGEAGKKQIEHLVQALHKNKSNRINCDLFEIKNGSLLHFDLIEVPGHAPDQVAFYDQSEQQLFAGDLLIEHISSNALVEPDRFGKRMKTLIEHEQSLRDCLSLSIEAVYSGHGNVIQHPKELIIKRLNGIKTKAERFLSLIKEGKTTACEVAQAYYKDIYTKQFSLVMSEVIGHLDYLEAQGNVEKRYVNGILHYAAI